MKEKEDMHQRVQEEYERQKIEEHKQTIKVQRQAEIRQRQIMLKMEEMEERNAVENLKVLNDYRFSYWLPVLT